MIKKIIYNLIIIFWNYFPNKKLLSMIIKRNTFIKKKLFVDLKFKGTTNIKVDDKEFKIYHPGYTSIENKLFWYGLDGWEKVSMDIWKKLSKNLDDEEEKGTRVYYSLRDTEGRMIEKEDVYLQNVKPSKELLAEEDKLTYEVDQKFDEMYIDRPAQDYNIFTDRTRDDFKMIAFLEKKKERIVIEQEARKISYDLRMY